MKPSPCVAAVVLLSLVVAVVVAAAGGCASRPVTGSAAADTHADVLFADDFTRDIATNWFVEAEPGGSVAARDGVLDVDVPGGCTIWFKQRIVAPVEIEFEATAVDHGGPNDRVSDLNCFWMARDARSPDDLFATKRGGRFEEYNPLTAYYVGLGGNANTTSRFRRYVGDPVVRPLLPQHDLRAPEDLLLPNRWQSIRLTAAGHTVRYTRDDRVMFELQDAEPYTDGWFAFRTVRSHLQFRHFRVRRPETSPASNSSRRF
jgi:hypothetical protein